MSLGTEKAKSTFEASVQGARDLILVHKDRNPHAGRRHGPDLTLNRSVIVLAVAAWQAYVEELTTAVLQASRPPSGSPLTLAYGVVSANVSNKITNLSTPNSQNTIALFALVNFDPRPAWNLSFSWERQRSTLYGSLRSRVSLTQSAVAAEMDAWLKCRHAVAHGNELTPTGSYSALITGMAAGRPVVLRRDADRCVEFFAEVVRQTARLAQMVYP